MRYYRPLRGVRVLSFEIVASLPYFQARETDTQRGSGVFENPSSRSSGSTRWDMAREASWRSISSPIQWVRFCRAINRRWRSIGSAKCSGATA